MAEIERTYKEVVEICCNYCDRAVLYAQDKRKVCIEHKSNLDKYQDVLETRCDYCIRSVRYTQGTKSVCQKHYGKLMK